MSRIPPRFCRKYRHLVSPITGVVNVVQSLNETPDTDSPIHVYVSGHNVAALGCRFEDFRRHLRSGCARKGMSDGQAKAGALAEAIERVSALFQPGLDVEHWASYRQLQAEAECIHPYRTLQYSEKQYRQREAWNAKRSRFNWVPEPFDEDAVIPWTPVWSLTARRHKYVPTQLCYLGYPLKPGVPLFGRSCSNGNAAGNSLEEAILQGFFELVERDAVAIWWYNRLRKPAVDLDSFDEPYFPRLRDHYRRLGRDVWVLDITTDLGVPSFAAVSAQRNRESQVILFGFGTHFDARLAVARALTEMNQMVGMAALSDGEPDGGTETPAIDDSEILHWLRTATLENQRYLVPAEHLPARRAQDYPRWESDDLLDDIRRCQALVEGKGLEMLVLDLTRPDIGMPAVKVMVPGLRHFWARFAPGRLYDVPVAMGELTRPLTEEELNPIPVFI